MKIVKKTLGQIADLHTTEIIVRINQTIGKHLILLDLIGVKIFRPLLFLKRISPPTGICIAFISNCFNQIV